MNCTISASQIIRRGMATPSSEGSYICGLIATWAGRTLTEGPELLLFGAFLPGSVEPQVWKSVVEGSELWDASSQLARCPSARKQYIFMEGGPSTSVLLNRPLFIGDMSRDGLTQL